MECISCGEDKEGNTEEGMICAFCYLILRIGTVEEAETNLKKVKEKELEKER